MKVSLEWLSDWIELPSVEKLEHRLTVGGLEIEGMERVGFDLSEFVVGKVLSREQHPNADRLSLCSVDVGGGEPVGIVCGATNVESGQNVVVALHGTTLPDGSKIKRSKIRGVTSNGMICSERELGLGNDHSGIMVLPDGAVVGGNAEEILARNDLILDISITPNRGDWLSMLGMAREVHAHFGGAIKLPEIKLIEVKERSSDFTDVDVAEGTACPKYCGRVIRDVTVGESPEWLRSRIESAGIRSVNNVVDITNYVMMELGQPLHAFDFGKIKGKVSVRFASSKERLSALNDKDYTLTPDDLVIADDENAIALAGVIGGANTQVGTETKVVFLEAAIFHPSRVRKTARRHGLSTDASYRFERGVDQEGVEFAIDRAACLIGELSGGDVLSGRIAVQGRLEPAKRQVSVDATRVNHLLGTKLTSQEMVKILGQLDIITTRKADTLVCDVPSFRQDLAIGEDLIEEIARIHGYDQIPATLPASPGVGITQPPLRRTVEELRDALCNAGLVELMTFSSARPNDIVGLRQSEEIGKQRVEIKNPIRAEEPFLRMSIVPSILRSVQQNLSRQNESVKVFEISRVFELQKSADLPRENSEAVAVIAGNGGNDLWHKAAPVLFEIKGLVESVLEKLGVVAKFNPQESDSYFHPGASGSYEVGGRKIAILGELHPDTVGHFGIEAPIALATFNVSELLQSPRADRIIKEVSRFPSVRRDFSVLLNAHEQSGEVVAAVEKTAGAILSELEVIDRYEGEGIPEGKMSLSLRLIFQRLERTLRDEEVSKVSNRVIKMLEKRFNGVLR